MTKPERAFSILGQLTTLFTDYKARRDRGERRTDAALVATHANVPDSRAVVNQIRGELGRISAARTPIGSPARYPEGTRMPAHRPASLPAPRRRVPAAQPFKLSLPIMIAIVAIAVLIYQQQKGGLSA